MNQPLYLLYSSYKSNKAKEQKLLLITFIKLIQLANTKMMISFNLNLFLSIRSKIKLNNINSRGGICRQECLSLLSICWDEFDLEVVNVSRFVIIDMEALERYGLMARKVQMHQTCPTIFGIGFLW